jgi:hypothetical protein
MKSIKASGLTVNNHVCLFISGGEENDMRCIQCYQDKERQPWRGFSPSGVFPAILGEEGVYRFRCNLTRARTKKAGLT